MSNPLRVLQVEDSESDAALVVHMLRKGDYEVEATRVESATEMRRALTQGPWDVIICDYHLPQFDGPAALKLVQDACLDVPFIVISGVIGEEIAVEMMKLGAQDYLMKDKLSRLVPAVQREVKDALVRRERTLLHAENALYESKLKKLKHFASRDPLTGLCSWREVERQIEIRIQLGYAFSLVSLDLNGFREFKDAFGHFAADDLLKQFAAELLAVFRPDDVVGRVGGDEFIVLVDGELPFAGAGLEERIRRWVKIGKPGMGKPGVQVERITPAAGSAKWKRGESMRDVHARAQAAMYTDKAGTGSRIG